MRNIFDLISVTKKSGACGLRFGWTSEAQSTNGKNWSPLVIQNLGAKLSPSWFREQVLPRLTEGERNSLQQGQFVQTQLRSPENQITKCTCFISAEKLFVELSWSMSEIKLSQWDLPTFFVDKLTTAPGLVWVYGAVSSGKSSLLRCLSLELANKKISSVFFSEQKNHDSQYVMDLDVSHFSSYRPSTREIVFVDFDAPNVGATVLDWAAAGHTVICSGSATSLSLLFRKKFGATPPWAFISETFTQSLGLKLAPGLESGFQPVVELISSTPEVLERISLGSVQSLVELAAQGGDKTGMRTFNQAVLQQILRRKIELRAGFDLSTNPIELDELLKKVGV